MGSLFQRSWWRVWVFLLGAWGGALGHAQPTGNELISIPLEPRDVGKSLQNWGLTVQPESTPFVGEPDAGKNTVLRQSLTLPGPESKPLPFLWNVTRGTLQLDLNRNRDLRDDPLGLYTNSALGYYQEFKDVLLPRPDSHGVRTQRVDLSLAGQGVNVHGFIAQRTYWHGKLTLDGKDYQVGLVEGWPGAPSAQNLLLRSWEARDKDFDLMGRSLDAFDYPGRLFFAGRLFDVTAKTEAGPTGSRLRLELQPQSPVLGDVRLTGTHLRRVILRGKRHAAVLDDPASSVRIPVDTYTETQVQLAGGSLAAMRTSGLAQTLDVTASKPAVLGAGGPLTNQVTMRRRGGMLVLSYQLLGADGARYQLDTTDRDPPQFRIRQDNRELASGKFEYG